jgi:hypothetical protein
MSRRASRIRRDASAASKAGIGARFAVAKGDWWRPGDLPGGAPFPRQRKARAIASAELDSGGVALARSPVEPLALGPEAGELCELCRQWPASAGPRFGSALHPATRRRMRERQEAADRGRVGGVRADARE